MTDAEFHAIRPHLEYVALPSHLRLHEAHQTFRFVYFPNEGLRVDSGTLRITYDFLATMLGTDRPSVSKAAGLFQRLNIIKYSRGAVKNLNRNALENQACECYAVI